MAAPSTLVPAVEVVASSASTTHRRSSSSRVGVSCQKEKGKKSTADCKSTALLRCDWLFFALRRRICLTFGEFK